MGWRRIIRTLLNNLVPWQIDSFGLEKDCGVAVDVVGVGVGESFILRRQLRCVSFLVRMLVVVLTHRLNILNIHLFSFIFDLVINAFSLLDFGLSVFAPLALFKNVFGKPLR